MISAGLGTRVTGSGLLRASAANSLSRTLLQSSTQLSQMNTPGPEMSFFTSAWDLPQKLHIVSWWDEPWPNVRPSGQLSTG